MGRWSIALVLALTGALVAAPHASAQTSARAPDAKSDSAFATQKTAFLALPEATRKAIQDSLVWLGFYNATNDGDFGLRTRDAILAWQKSVKAAPDGVLDPNRLQALLAAGLKSRDAAGFKTITDKKTGAKVGAPAKLFARGVKLDFVSDPNGDLAALYAKLAVETPTRKVSYKAMKPNSFFVVAGQESGGQNGPTKFYMRYDRQEGASPPIRGFVFSYPAANAADFDRLAVAVANSFEPFPSGAQGTPAASPAAPLPPAAKATALVIAPGRAVTALKPADCANPTIAGKPVRFEKTGASGLAVLVGDFAANGAEPTLGPLSSDLVALSARGDKVAASPAAVTKDAQPKVVAALEPSAAGGPLFDRAGRLVGLVGPSAAAPKRVGGVALASSWPVIDSDAIGAFLGGGGVEIAPPASPPLSAGRIADREKGAIVGVFCGK